MACGSLRVRGCCRSSAAYTTWSGNFLTAPRVTLRGVTARSCFCGSARCRRSPDAAREVMKIQDLAFATRPLTATMHVVTCDGPDIVFAPYGEYSSQLRKIAVTELLTVRRVLSFRAIREEEVAAMLRDVESAAAARRPVEMHARLSAVFSDTTFRSVMGDRCRQRDMFLRELEKMLVLSAGLNPVELWPSSWLAGRLSGAIRRTEESHATVSGIIRGIVQERMEGKGGGEEAEDLLDVLLKIHKDGGVDMVAVEAVVFDIFAAGSETSTMEWAMAELIKNPAVMKKATAEVRRAFEADGMAVEDRLWDAAIYQVEGLARGEKGTGGGRPSAVPCDRTSPSCQAQPGLRYLALSSRSGAAG